jgi:hypothetical protein
MSVLASTFLCCLLYWAYFSFEIGAGKTTAVLAVKSVDAGALRHTSNHLGRPEGTPVHSLVTPAGCQHRGQQLLLNNLQHWDVKAYKAASTIRGISACILLHQYAPKALLLVKSMACAFRGRKIYS